MRVWQPAWWCTLLLPAIAVPHDRRCWRPRATPKRPAIDRPLPNMPAPSHDTPYPRGRAAAAAPAAVPRPAASRCSCCRLTCWPWTRPPPQAAAAAAARTRAACGSCRPACTALNDDRGRGSATRRQEAGGAEHARRLPAAHAQLAAAGGHSLLRQRTGGHGLLRQRTLCNAARDWRAAAGR